MISASLTVESWGNHQRPRVDDAPEKKREKKRKRRRRGRRRGRRNGAQQKRKAFRIRNARQIVEIPSALTLRCSLRVIGFFSLLANRTSLTKTRSYSPTITRKIRLEILVFCWFFLVSASERAILCEKRCSHPWRHSCLCRFFSLKCSDAEESR